MAKKKKARKPKKNKWEVNKKSWLTNQLRRLSLKWPPRMEALKRNRRKYVKLKKDGTPYKRAHYEHQCASCGEWFPSSQINLDHIEPVVDPKNSDHLTLEEFIGMFAVGLMCELENWQKLCVPCHDEKTALEQEIRYETKKKIDKSK